MPHKRRKRSERVKHSDKLGFDNPPAAPKDDLPKSLSRILFAADRQKAYKERKKADTESTKPAAEDLPKIRQHESLKQFSRRAEMELRPKMNAALRAANDRLPKKRLKKKPKRREESPEDLHEPVDQRIAQKRGQETSEVKEFKDRPERVAVNDVVEAPPTLNFGKKKKTAAGGSSKVPLSLSQQEAIARERQVAIQRYRDLKQRDA